MQGLQSMFVEGEKWKEKIYRIDPVIMESLFLPYTLEKLFEKSSSM